MNYEFAVAFSKINYDNGITRPAGGRRTFNYSFAWPTTPAPAQEERPVWIPSDVKIAGSEVHNDLILRQSVKDWCHFLKVTRESV